MKYIFVGMLGIAVLVWLLRPRGPQIVRGIAYADLTADEQRAQRLVQEVHGAAIKNEANRKKTAIQTSPLLPRQTASL
jgi:hypothetical protein